MQDKIDEFTLAPSKITEAIVIPVAVYIFGCNFASRQEIKQYAGATSMISEVEVLEPQLAEIDTHEFVKWMTVNFKLTHNLVEEEHPGYLLLGTLIVFFGKCTIKYT